MFLKGARHRKRAKLGPRWLQVGLRWAREGHLRPMLGVLKAILDNLRRILGVKTEKGRTWTNGSRLEAKEAKHLELEYGRT